MSTLIVGGVLLLILAAIVYSMIRKKKAGKHIVCDGGCGHCKGCH